MIAWQFTERIHHMGATGHSDQSKGGHTLMARAPELGTGSSKQLLSFHNTSRFATMPNCIGKHA